MSKNCGRPWAMHSGSGAGTAAGALLRGIWGTAAAVCAVAGWGCAAPDRVGVERPNLPPRGVMEKSDEMIRQDPLAYLEHVAALTRALEQYTVVLTRQERRGFGPFKRLHPPERIQCWFRRTPFSIRFLWTDPQVKYGESTYVAGVEGGRVRFTPRVSLFGLKPEIVRVRPMTPVLWGEARYPVTEFGLERLMEQTLAYIAQAGGRCRVEYLGRTTRPHVSGELHHFRISYPPDQHEAPVQELYIDAASDLPAGTVSRFLDGALDAAYYYSELDRTVRLSDDDFLLATEKRARETTRLGGGAQPAAAALESP